MNAILISINEMDGNTVEAKLIPWANTNGYDDVLKALKTDDADVTSVADEIDAWTYDNVLNKPGTPIIQLRVAGNEYRFAGAVLFAATDMETGSMRGLNGDEVKLIAETLSYSNIPIGNIIDLNN